MLSATAAAALLLGAAGCTDLDEASAAGISHDDLLSEVSIQLARVTGLTYTATYQLTGGGTATVAQAQKPSRTAYVFPGGRLIQSVTGSIHCTGDKAGSPSRTVSPNPSTSTSTGTGTSGNAGGTSGNASASASGNVSASASASGNATGPDKTGDNTSGASPACTETAPAPASTAPLPGSTLITPEAALAMLNTAALDQKVDATQHDTTIAGRHALCLDVDNVDGTPARRLSLCVTNEGALGSFAATIAGTHYEQALTTYTEKTAPDAFDLPPAAKLTDKRAK
jgi:hypothetical protein